MIETKKNEIRYVTSDPAKMLNKYLAKRVLKTWTEDFIDESTNETVSIERNEILFERGTLIDQDVLAKIRFSMDADGVKEVEVSNQKRIAVELHNNYLYPYIAQVSIDNKKEKFLLYASSLDTTLLILKDYIELNYSKGFFPTMIKEFDSCIILTDSLKELKFDTLPFDEEPHEDDNTEEKDKSDKKFYQIEAKITYNEDLQQTNTFVVHTFNVERAMMLITDYCKKKEDEYEASSKKRGNEYKKRDIHAMIETAKVLPVGRFIPEEFSMAYID